MAIRLQYDIKANDWSTARQQADETVATFIRKSGLIEFERKYDTFTTDTIDTSTTRESSRVVSAFSTTVTSEFR